MHRPVIPNNEKTAGSRNLGCRVPISELVYVTRNVHTIVSWAARPNAAPGASGLGDSPVPYPACSL